MSETSYFSADENEEATTEREEEKYDKEAYSEEGEEEKEVYKDKRVLTEEEEEEEEATKREFPIEIMKGIVKDIAKEYKGFSPEIFKEFNALLDEEKFLNEKRPSILQNDARFTDKKIIEIVKNMIRKTSIPGPGDELYNDLYKVLVKNLSADLRQSDTTDLDAEVTARKLAAWVLSFDEQLNILGDNPEEQREQSLPQNPYYYKSDRDGSSYRKKKTDGSVKLYNLTEQHTRPYWHEPGEVVELRDQEGSQIYVKGLDEGEGKKTLVKKVRKTNKGKEVSSWIVEVADSEQIKSVEENLRLGKGVVEKTPKSKLKSPATVDEWKTVADIRREEAKGWNNLLGRDSCKGESTSTSTSGAGTSKSTDPRRPVLNEQKGNEANRTTNKYLMDAADLKRSLKGFQNVNLDLNPEQENYLINELRKKSNRRKY